MPFSTRTAAAIVGIVLLACGAREVLAQSGTQNTDNPGFREHGAVHPPMLFREVWKQPPHTGPLNDDNRRITPEALTNADLSRADLISANLTHTNLGNARLEDARLSRAKLNGANLSDANLLRADLTEADLSHADLPDARKDGPIVPRLTPAPQPPPVAPGSGGTPQPVPAPQPA